MYDPQDDMKWAMDRQQGPFGRRARQLLREEFTPGQREALAMMIRTACALDTPVAGTPERILDLLENDGFVDGEIADERALD